MALPVDMHSQAAYDRLQASPVVEPIMLRSPCATYTTRCEEGPALYLPVPARLRRFIAR